MKTRTKALLAAAGIILAAGVQAAALAGGWMDKVDRDLVAKVQAEGTAEFLVAMGSRADLALAEGARGRAAKSAIVMQILKAHAASTQAGVLQQLVARGRDYRSFWVANAVSTSGTLADIQALALRADVAHIYLVKEELVDLPGGVEGVEDAQGATLIQAVEAGNVRIHAPEVWALGFRGQGVVVGDHDIGVRWTHQAIKKKYRGWNEATQTADHAYNWHNAFPADHYCADPAVPCDSHNHGTHTTGTMVGGDGAEQIGMAPDAKWIACRSLYDNVAGAGTVPTYLDCMQWMIAPYPAGDTLGELADPSRGPDVVNNSWGCLEACAPPVLKDVNDATKAAGIVQIASAGNDGQGGTADCSTLAFPLGVYDSTFTVGASNTANEGMASFSSKGPVLSDGSMRIKPNVVAPGVGTRSSVKTSDTSYGSMSGTSMAAPHVAGLIALVMSAEPRLIGRVDDVRALVERTSMTGVASTQACGGIPATTIPNNVFGYGRVDALAAVLARPQISTAITAPGAVAVGSAIPVALVFSQPATGKIDVTGAEAIVNVPAGLQYVSAAPAPAAVSTNAAGTTLRFTRAAALAPGASWNVALQLAAGTVGSHSIVTATEADQVSPGFGGNAVITVDTGDADGDGVRDPADNCPDVANTDQADVDADGAGDACDATDDRDVDPEAFTFADRVGVLTNVFVTSEGKAIAGIDAGVPVSIANGQYSVEGGAYTSSAGTIGAGQVLRVRHVSASAPGTATTSTVTVGTYSTTFTSTTTSVDGTPDAFSFPTQAGVEPASEILSGVVTPSGYNTAVAVVAGPNSSYRIDGGAWTTASGTINPGQTLQTKHTSAATSLAYTKTYVKVGAVTGYFTTRTK
jgi:serine protease AprX